MGFPGADAVDGPLVAERLRTDATSLSPAGARSVAATLLADAVFSEPFCEWMPLWYEIPLLPAIRYGEWRLRRVARAVVQTSGITVSAPRFTRPRDVGVGGRPALDGVSGFRERFLLADSLLHLEWFVHVAAADGIEVPVPLVERTRHESLAYYAGDRDELSPRVREFQHLLFGDDQWVRRVDAAYDLDSRLFGLWERILRAERERLAAV